MAAQPAYEEPGIEDPTEILRLLPERFHDQFRREYAAAVEYARDPRRFRGLAELLRLWRLRATAYSDPGYSTRLAAAHASERSDELPAERVMDGWPRW